MADIKVFTGNRLEILAGALADLLLTPLSSPFDQEIIVVQSKGMERWLSMQLAERHGVCMNCRFPFPNAFVKEIFRMIRHDIPELSLFEPDVMTWRIMKVFPSLIEAPAFNTIRIYLESDQSDLKRFQLSQRIADLFDQYLLFRPEMMFRWEQGKAKHWQAFLWRRLAEAHGHNHRAALAKELFTALEMSTKPPAGFPRRISVFGISALPRFYVQVLSFLTRIIQVNLFLMNPCKEYWGDILATSEMKKRILPQKAVHREHLHLEQGNSLLASMGGLGRDFFEMIQELQMEEISLYEEPEEKNLLTSIQHDVLHLYERREKKEISPEDLSIQVHSCHSPMREVEVLWDQLLRMLEEVPGLLPKDILVMMPDIEGYSPYIQAVFDRPKEESRRIPFSIADRNVREEGGIGEALLNILDLEGGRFGVTQILNILESRAVRCRFGFSDEDLEKVREWVSETGIRWGIDENHKKVLGLPSFPQNTWRAGLDRLLLGFAMPGRDENLFCGILPHYGVEGGETRILGSLTDFAEKLFERSASFGRLKTLEAWQMELAKLLEDFFEPGEELEQELQMIRRMLDHLVETGRASGFDEPVHLRIVRSCLRQGLEETGFGFGFMTGGVTFCAMLPMRSIPFRVICLLGMDGEAYPRQSKPLGFDYMARYPRRGDRSRRNDDRYIFLEALLSARERLYISFVGQSIQDNSTIAPCVPVSELLDYAEQGFKISDRDIRGHLVTRHRLQAFSPEYFKNHPKLFTHSEEHHEIARSLLSDRKEPGPFVTEGLTEPDETWRKLGLDGLCAFYSNPAKFLLSRRLGMYLEEKFSLTEDREPFEVVALERYRLEETMLRRRLQGRALKEDFLFTVASNRLPHGTLGQCFYENLSSGVERFVQELKPLMGGQCLAPLEFELSVGSFSLTGTLDGIFKDGMIRYRYGRSRGKDFVVSWIHHLVLTCLRPEGYPRHTVLAGLSGKSGKERKRVFYEYRPPEEGEAILDGLLKRYWEGLKSPLHFFPESSWNYADQRLSRVKPPEESLEQAVRTWEGNEWSRGELEDSYYQLCFRGSNPIDSQFEEIAVEVFEPLLKHLREKSRQTTQGRDNGGISNF
ncbi:MAG: exodeoxyribonuclease V subunit gamma [Deltaproteobacteria bacterium]|nr:exodeoxyribonuclease V subunit gamma [Deltaproteobacteria bacterium]